MTLDNKGWDLFYAGLVANGYQGSLQDCRRIWQRHSTASDLRSNLARWQHCMPPVQYASLTQLYALCAKRFTEVRIFQRYSGDGVLFGLDARIPTSKRIRIEGLRLEINDGDVRCVAYVQNDYRRERTFEFGPVTTLSPGANP